MRAQASARIPIAVGLTLAHVWKKNEADDDHECLTQVVSVELRTVTLTESCDRKDRPKPRRLCRDDLRHASTYQTEFSPFIPDLVGITSFTLSEQSFDELKRNGLTRHRYLQLNPDGKPPTRLVTTWNIAGSVRELDDAPGERWRSANIDDRFVWSVPVIVNDRTVDLPARHVRGFLESERKSDTVEAMIVDDPAVPLVLDYRHEKTGFRIKFVKISFPASDALEHALETEKHADVYGIYFDFNSDVLRPESEPVLREIADLLQKHADWTLAVQGHTDNVGGDAFNLDLSNRRSAAVRKALVDRYRIAGKRLTTAGFGASQPKAPNDTPEGRAKNRRVELVRQ
ncbi:MAG TPA: OmpA family protein [Vicinamibacterales bacterium]|nr:OmpA family protein [Vicinamibacterales bacterium]